MNHTTKSDLGGTLNESLELNTLVDRRGNMTFTLTQLLQIFLAICGANNMTYTEQIADRLGVSFAWLIGENK